MRVFKEGVLGIKDIVSHFNTTPFLFVGSGLSRRYYDLPDWRSLLELFARRISNDSFAFVSYENKAKGLEKSGMVYPKIAELIEKDFNEMWYSDVSKRELDEYYLQKVLDGASPFKAEIAMFIKNNSKEQEKYKSEIRKLKAISSKSISGVITTNYDTFLENVMDEYKIYVGQEELLFSSIQGIAEVYKIHGSVDDPNSILINKNDYLQFDQRSSYLAAKLMTIFMEYPIIFIGYSLADTNIQKIIKSIVGCLSDKKIEMLKNRFIFIEYDKNISGVEITSHSMHIDEQILAMTKISLSDFNVLYESLADKKTQLPVKLLRHFKEELYDYTLTNRSTANLRVASIDDGRIEDDELIIAIGKVSDLGLKGLSGISSAEWYQNVILEDLGFSADELFEYAFPKLIKQNSGRLPIFKYIKQTTRDFDEVNILAEKINFNSIISESIKKDRKKLGDYKSIKEVWKKEKCCLEKATRLMAYFEENLIKTDELREVLQEIFSDNPKILEKGKSGEKTNIRRLIKIYDILKYK